MKLLPTLLAFASLALVPVRAAETSKPNILFILVDHFGARDLGCYGSTVYETPHLDRLDQSGARFTQADTGDIVTAAVPKPAYHAVAAALQASP